MSDYRDDRRSGKSGSDRDRGARTTGGSTGSRSGQDRAPTRPGARGAGKSYRWVFNLAALWENKLIAYVELKAQISCVVTAHLIGAFFSRCIDSTLSLHSNFKLIAMIFSGCTARLVSDLVSSL